ncbi:MarR family winged helix-turn-helix transcriptional regulator [Anaerosacchariphilus polymeriproducens]|uniref:MarR family transcriptional regulator n=1 Tax=Anaerosacchariphilus polymeriproducens TaxID=1812858 RepID=A0A371ATX1_9FIRM|nr:MarR family transcriptional regulator [Anaerosacchariphilus polymeriproducens]RDU23014.1 MarR family transcriptional regulator [Anaerosacchariphilus polymeriproducens]
MNQYDSKYMLIRLLCIMKIINNKTYNQSFEPKLYPGQPQILVFLKHNQGISQKELSKKHKSRPASISGILQKLEKQDLIKRETDINDKRILRVYLTPTGEKLANQADEFLNHISEIMFKNFTKEEKECYLNILDKISNNL